MVSARGLDRARGGGPLPAAGAAPRDRGTRAGSNRALTDTASAWLALSPMREKIAGFAAALIVLALPGVATAKDFAATALNIIPSGQYGSLPIPAGADQQAQMYDGLTPLFDNVQPGDLTKYFKSEAFNSIGTDGPAKTEKVPRKGVKITRDKFNVPHVKATTYDGGIWAAGWLLGEDRQ